MQIDTLIGERIRDSLRSFPFVDTKNIQISVYNGEVTLRGTVREASDARVILTESLLVRGVCSVIDNLNYKSEAQSKL